MKGDFQPRPESKSRNNKIRPVSRYANVELAQQCFKNAKELQKKESYDKAIQQYLRALMYNPSYFQAYCNMGSCYRAQGKYLEARSMYLKSISIKNDDAISEYNLANLQRIIGNYQSSINHYESVIKLSGSQNVGSLLVNSLINLGICYKIIGQYEKAIEYYEKAKKIDPSDESIIYNQAMTYIALLQTLNIDIFHQVSKQRASKAQVLLKQILKKNPNHEMALIKYCRVSSILDKSNANLKQNVSKLKGMLANKNYELKDEINLQLAYTLKLLKQYEESITHYNESFNKNEPKVLRKPVQSNIYDSQQSQLNTKIAILSEQQAIKSIKQGRVDEVRQSLSRMDDNNISKHVIQLAIQLELAEIESQDHLNKAIQIYHKYFTADKAQLPFEKVSIEAHKLIGKVLSSQNKFKQSIKHFEYISSQLKSNVERSAIHSSLGNEYEALGDKQKALQQYRLALQEQPQNYELVYNVGCCLHDRGDHQQSNIYFQKFLQLIKNDPKIYLPTKNLYIADCLVTMAGSSANSSQQFQRYQNAWKAIKQVRQGEQEGGVEFDNQKMMNFYLRWADLLEEKILNFSDKRSERYIESKETLLNVYISLLQTQSCPDRDAILNNCAILYYQSKLYVNALSSLNQISMHTPFSMNSLALTYFHLGQHIMATKSIYSAVDLDSKDSLILFSRQLIEWVYGISKKGRIYDLFENQNDSLIFVRWQYAIIVFDSLSKRLKLQKQDVTEEAIESIISTFYEKDNIERNLDEDEKIKYRFITSRLQSSKKLGRNGPQNIDDLITICTTASHNIEKDLKGLIEKIGNNRQLNDTVIQLLLNIFIFTNKSKAHSIKAFLQGNYSAKQQICSVDLDRRVTIDEDIRNKQYNFSNLNDIIVNFCSWECEIEDKIRVIMHIIQKIYYRLSVRHPIEIEYHFPRHNNVQICSMTINRMIYLIYNTFKVKSDIKLKETYISAMKSQLIDEIDADFQIHMRKESFISLSLGKELRVLTLHANFNSREQCIKFIKELQKQSSEKNSSDITRSQQGILMIISGVVAVSCTWTEKDTLKNAIKSLLKSPLEIYLQSILQIEENIDFIQDPNEKMWQKLIKLQAFKRN